jgi:hypothetical protein
MKAHRTAKAKWERPRMETKPLEDTRAGRGLQDDGVFEMQS